MTGGEHQLRRCGEFAEAQHQLSNEGIWNATAQTDAISTTLYRTTACGRKFAPAAHNI